MTSTEQAVNKILADLSRIPREIHSNSKNSGFVDLDEIARKVSDKTMMELKSRGIV